MKLRNIILLTAAILCVAAVSCKKEEEDKIKPSLSGMYFNVIPYLRINQEVTITPLEVTHPDGKGIGYYWQIDGGQIDTVKKEDAPAPASLAKTVSFSEPGSHTILCSAFASGYYNTSCSVSVTVVNPEMNGMVKENDIFTGDPFIVDTRSGVEEENTYYYIHIGSLDWMRNNMAYTGSGVPYREAEVTSYPLGRYYSWEEAQAACPSGWRLPTMAEWESLGTVAGDFMVNALLLDSRIWEFWPQVKITNKNKLSVIPSGYALLSTATRVFKGFGDYAAFWSADTYAGNAEQASYVYIYEQDPEVKYGQADKTSVGLSVRCVR